MAALKVPDEDCLMRFVPYGQQVRDPETDEFLGILSAAFNLRNSDDGGLSVTWAEHYGPKCAVTFGKAAKAFRDSLESKKIGKKSYFALGTAGSVRSTSAKYQKQIRLVHAPDGPNTGHVEIRRFTDEDRLLLDALALDVFNEHVAVAGLQL